MFRFDNSYARLPPRFFERVTPAKARAPRIVKVNRALASELGIDGAALDSPGGAEVLSGNVLPDGAEPIALAYAGHQFGSFVPRLGDGRAVLLGEVVGARGQRRDVQLKGAGRTPFSRGGDGRAALGPVLREYLVSEAMFALGIPTTRALAAVTTGDPVAREGLLPGAVLARVASSHIRVGTFQYLAARDDLEGLATLASYALARHYPDAVGSDDDALALLERVVGAQASLVASWLGVGFIHGVMNTDNTSVAGETIDYGPCAFLDEYDPDLKLSSIDTGGRYAFGNQPRVAMWNLARLAEALLPLVARRLGADGGGDHDEEAVKLAEARLALFQPAFEAAYGAVLHAKLGIGGATAAREPEGVRALALDLLERLAANSVDYTLFFRRLSACAEDTTGAADASVASLFSDGSPGAFHDWAEAWRALLARDDAAPAARAAAMRRANPAFIPRNHRVEEVIAAAVDDGDLRPFEALLDAVTRPYDDRADRPELARFMDPPKPEERVTATFCGT
jgi:uncharacterized protein YdiU (UPF0061 family)